MRMQFLVVLATMLLLSACNSGAATLQPSDTPTPAVRFENIRSEREDYIINNIPLENCNNTILATQHVSRSESTTIETDYGGGIDISGGIKALLDVKLQAQFNVKNGETKEAKQEYDLSVEGGKKVAYAIHWYTVYQAGDAVIDTLNARIPFRVRIGLEGELISGSPQSCQSANVPIAAVTTTAIPPTTTPEPSASPVPTTATLQPSDTPKPTQSPTNTPVPPPPTQSPTLVPPTFTAVAKAYPCDATVISPGSLATTLNVVRLRADSNSPLQDTVRVGQVVHLLRSSTDSLSTRWYQIDDENSNRLGWIPGQYVKPANNCPA